MLRKWNSYTKVKELMVENGEDDAYFQLSIDSKGKPEIFTFSGQFFDEAIEEAEWHNII